ncbi:hypothetical protein ACWD4T_23675 [Streptomyces umbrinus]
MALALLGFTLESCRLRFVDSRLAAISAYIARQLGWNKGRWAALLLVERAVRLPAVDTDFWFDNP